MNRVAWPIQRARPGGGFYLGIIMILSLGLWAGIWLAIVGVSRLLGM